MFDKLKLIERKYLIISIVFILMAFGMHSIVNAPGSQKITDAKKSLTVEEDSLKSTQEQVSAAKGTGVGNIADVAKSIDSYEALVGKDIDELIFDNTLSNIAKTSGVVITPPQRSERYMITDKGIGYYNFKFNATGTFDQLRSFFTTTQGAAGYLTSVGETVINFQGVVTNPDGTTSAVANPFLATMTTSATIRVWVDLSDRLIAKGVSSREEGLASNKGSTTELTPGTPVKK